MTQEFIIYLLHTSVKVGLLLSSPFLLSALISGLIVSIFQAVTQINEQTLSFIPKIIAVCISGFIFGPWMLKIIIDYMQNIFRILPKIVLLT